MNSALDTPREQIKAICEAIRASPLATNDKRKFFKRRYPNFTEDYPALFDACLNPRFPLEFLDYMLDVRERVRAGTAVEDADKEVYGKLSDRYIAPVLAEKEAKEAAAAAKQSPGP